MSLSRFEDPGRESPGFLFWKLSRQYERRVSDVLKPLGLGHTEFVALSSVVWLSASGSEVSQVDVARFVSMDAQTISVAVRRLEEKGLVARDVGVDSRVRRLRATARGKDLGARAIAAVEAIDKAFFKAVDPVFLLSISRNLGGQAD